MSTLLRRTAPTVGDMYAVVFGVKEGVNDGCCAPVVPRYRVRHMCATSHVVSVLSRRTSNLGAVVARRIGPLASGRANVGHLRVTGNGWRAMRVSGLVRWWRKLPGGLLWRACDGRVPNIDSSVVAESVVIARRARTCLPRHSGRNAERRHAHHN